MIHQKDITIKETQPPIIENIEESSSEMIYNENTEIVFVAGKIDGYGTEVIMNEESVTVGEDQYIEIYEPTTISLKSK